MKHWRKVLALVVLVGIICFLVFDWPRFLSDFWPLDRSFVGPNIVATFVQWAVALIILALIYPPTRRAIEKFFTSNYDDLKKHVSAEHDALHEKLDHLIEHHPNKAGRDFTPTKERPPHA